MDEYIIKNISEETIGLYKQCFDLNGSPKKEEKLRWQFLQTPINKQYVDIAYLEERKKVAGIFAVFPVRFKIGDTEAEGTQGLDTMVDKEFRGEGLFIVLARSVYKRCMEDGLKLVYGFPNKESIKAAKILSWKKLDQVPFMLRPLKTKYFTKNIKYLRFLPNINLPYFKWNSKRFEIKEEHAFPVDVNQVWKRFSSHFQVAVIRDKQYLDWRYIAKPGEQYHIKHCYSGGEYKGYIVYAVKEKHNGLIGYIMELIYDTGTPQAGEELLISAVKDIKKKGADCILSWCFEHSPNRKVFEKSFFINIPEKLVPIKLHFTLRSFDKEISGIIEEKKNWYLSYSDSDTV